jgi:hypothetical protein
MYEYLGSVHLSDLVAEQQKRIQVIQDKRRAAAQSEAVPV